MTNHRLGLLRTAFALSGCSALILQVVWFRKISLFLGATAEAASVTLAVFMLGLAVGSALAKPLLARSRSPLLLLACVELGIAAYGVSSLHVLDAAAAVYGHWFGGQLVTAASRRIILRSAACAVGLIVPTTLMGLTFPVLLQAVKPQQKNAGAVSADFYAANTSGAALGALMTGFFLIGFCGLTGSAWIAGAMNAAAAVSIFIYSRSYGLTSPRSEAGSSVDPDTGVASLERRLVLAAVFFVAGFSTFALETLWTRWLIFVVGGNSVYAFGLILFGFLAGIQWGSRQIARKVDRFDDPLATFGIVIILVGVTALLASAVIGTLPIALDAAGLDSTTRHGVGTFVAFMFVLAPAALGGTTVSLAARELFRGQQLWAGDMGRYYAINTLGGVLGALLAGFVLLPWAGLGGGIVVVAAVNVCAGLVTSFRLGARRMTAPLALTGTAAGLAAVIYFLPPAIMLKLNHNTDALLYYSESSDASVAVVRNNQNQELSLLVHGDRQAGSGRLHEIHLRFLGHLPGLFSEKQQDALVIGLGAGFTTGSILTHPFTRVTQVEISRSVPPASRYFEHLTGYPLNDPRLHLLFDDGRNVLLTTGESFDAITTDPIDPNDAGATSLYAKEYYELVKGRLRPGGVAAQWMGLQSDLADYRILIRTFQTVFPMTYLWVAGNTTVVIGFKDSPRVERSEVERRINAPRVQESLAAINIHSLNDLLASMVGFGDDLKQVIGGGPINTDNFPLTEYSRSGIVEARPFVESILNPLMKDRQQAVASLFPVQ